MTKADEPTNDEKEPLAYIGRAACGCIVAAIVDETPMKPWKETSKWMKKGLAVDRVTCQYVRDNMRRCPHKQTTDKPLPLLEEK